MPTPGLTVEEKIARMVGPVQKDLTSSAANVFSSDVPNGKQRYLVGISITSPDASPQAFTLRRVLSDDSTQEIFDSVYIDAQSTWSPYAPRYFDISQPFLVLRGQQNVDIAMDTSGKTGTATVWYYDDPV